MSLMFIPFCLTAVAVAVYMAAAYWIPFGRAMRALESAHRQSGRHWLPGRDSGFRWNLFWAPEKVASLDDTREIAEAKGVLVACRKTMARVMLVSLGIAIVGMGLTIVAGFILLK